MRFSKPWKLLPLLLPVLATACSAAPSSVVNSCQDLPYAQYTRAQQAQVAHEMDKAPASAEWPVFIHDYGTLRATLRACK